MGLFLFVFTVMAVVTAMVIRIRDLEEGVKTKGREDHF